MHHGPVVERGDDIFGTSVNLAARVAGQASAGEVLGTAQIAAAARDSGIFAASIGTVELRNLTAPVELFEIHLIEVDADSYTVDPVCRMRVEPSHAVGWLRHGGTGWWFCSLECAAAFVQEPDTYARMNK
jgi:adenylate cyclase